VISNTYEFLSFHKKEDEEKKKNGKREREREKKREKQRRMRVAKFFASRAHNFQ